MYVCEYLAKRTIGIAENKGGARALQWEIKGRQPVAAISRCGFRIACYAGSKNT